MKPCQTCTHYRPVALHWLIDRDGRYAKCYRRGMINPVTNKPDPDYCSLERGYRGSCGTEGKYHTEKKS